MTKHNKLVRDKIPAIIAAQGRKPITKTLSGEEYKICLEQKLQEEVAEYIQDKNSEELADILEVVYALAQDLGVTPQQLEQVRLQKALESGGFTRRQFLVSVDD